MVSKYFVRVLCKRCVCGLMNFIFFASCYFDEWFYTVPLLFAVGLPLLITSNCKYLQARLPGSPLVFLCNHQWACVIAMLLTHEVLKKLSHSYLAYFTHIALDTIVSGRLEVIKQSCGRKRGAHVVRHCLMLWTVERFFRLPSQMPGTWVLTGHQSN